MLLESPQKGQQGVPMMVSAEHFLGEHRGLQLVFWQLMMERGAPNQEARNGVNLGILKSDSGPGQFFLSILGNTQTWDNFGVSQHLSRPIRSIVQGPS